MTDFDHSPAEVIQQLLIDLLLGTDEADDDSWPVFATVLPDATDDSINDAICVTDTEGVKHGRLQVTGETPVHYGIQVKVRSENHVDGYVKAKRISSAIDGVNRNLVYLDGDTYTVHAITKTGPVISLGRRQETRGRLFVQNALVAITMEAGTGS